VKRSIALILLLNLLALVAPVPAAAAEPKGFEYFHT
jgi:hypothetical protein